MVLRRIKMLLLKLLIILGFAYQAVQAVSKVGLNSSWTFTSSSADDGIALRNGKSGIACGFSQLRRCEDCEETSIYFSIHMLGSTPGTVGEIGNGPASYLGHIFWIANRNRPVSMNSTLKLENDGNLVLRDADGSIAWESNTGRQGVVEMELLESGNLVLFNQNRETVWESFGVSGDALAYRQRLKVGGIMRSSLSDFNMSEGSFYLEVESDRVSLRHKSTQKYGEWCTGQGSISFIQVGNGSLDCYDLNDSLISSVSFGPPPDNFFLNNQFLQIRPDGDLRAYVSEGDVSAEPGVSINRFFLDSSTPCGKVPAACGTYGVCTNTGDCSCFANFSSPVDPNDLKLGCVLNNRLASDCDINKSELIEFQGFNTLLSLAAEESLPNSVAISVDECKTSCSRNCSCLGVVHTAGAGCFYLTEVLTLWNSSLDSESRPSTTFLKTGVPPSEPPSSRHNRSFAGKKKKWSTVYIVAAIVLATAIILVLALWKFYNARAFAQIGSRKKKKMIKKGNEANVTASPNSPRYLEFYELCQMTNNFGTKLGEGGFSTVFQGILPDGSKVAVKRLETARQGVKQFEAEVRTIGSIHHKNLVSLQGYGAEDGYYYLVYDFVENLSLDRWLFHKHERQEEFPQNELPSENVLNWQQRCRIALDIARGLHYLHDGCKDRVLHLDIKPQNILLDGNFEAKICDFGLARMPDRDDDGFVNTIMRGTPGYMAPEWLHSRVSDKTDVYSLGIVLLELVSGKKTLPIPASLSSQAMVVRTKVFEQVDTLLSNVDPRLLLFESELNLRQVEEISRIGVLCVQADPLQRPSVGNVLKMLEESLIMEPGNEANSR